MLLEIYRFSIEWEILEWFYRIGNPFFDYVFYLISEFGSSIAIILIATFIYWCNNKEKGKLIAFICFFGICFNNVLKGIFNAKRPFLYKNKAHLRKLDGTSLSDGASGSSFPSGHSQHSATLFSSLFINFKNRPLRIVSLILMILIPISRLYLGVHFPGDVIVGVICGIVTTVGLMFLINKFPDHYILICFFSLIIMLPFIFIPTIGKDFFKGIGLLLGLIIGNYIEERYIKFKTIKNKKINAFRYLIGLLVTGSLYGIIHIINHLDFIERSTPLLFASNFITHAILCFVGIAIIPLLFKKLSFLKEKEDE